MERGIALRRSINSDLQSKKRSLGFGVPFLGPQHEVFCMLICGASQNWCTCHFHESWCYPLRMLITPWLNILWEKGVCLVEGRQVVKDSWKESVHLSLPNFTYLNALFAQPVVSDMVQFSSMLASPCSLKTSMGCGRVRHGMKLATWKSQG